MSCQEISDKYQNMFLCRNNNNNNSNEHLSGHASNLEHLNLKSFIHFPFDIPSILGFIKPILSFKSKYIVSKKK